MATSPLPTLEFPPIKRSALLRQLACDIDPPVSSLDDIRDYVEMYDDKESQKCVLNKHQQATDVHTMMTQFSHHAHRALFTRRCASGISNRRSKLQRTRSDRRNLRDVASESRKAFDTAAQQRWDAMKQRHAEEIAKHEKKRPNSEVTPKFRKRSSELLDLLITERRLGFQARADEVKVIRAEIDKMEAIEAKTQFQAAVRDWEVKLGAIEERHRREEIVMQQWIETRQQEYDKDRDVQLEAIAKRSKLLNTEIREIRSFSSEATKHAVRRKCGFERGRSRGMIESTPILEQIDKLSTNLPERARQELLKCRY